MQPDEHHDHRGGSWANWTVLRSVEDHTVIKQIGDTCGHCAARMLLARSGNIVSHARIVEVIGHENMTSAPESAAAISAVTGSHRAFAEFLTPYSDADSRFALYYPHWWLAMIKEFRRDAHWVVVRGCGDDGTLEILDPADGTRCWVLWSEFDAFWTRIVVELRDG